MKTIKLPQEVIDVLNQSSSEIRTLRAELNVNKMRLDIYDNMMTMFKTSPQYGMGHHGRPDPVYGIEQLLKRTEVETPETNTKNPEL